MSPLGSGAVLGSGDLVQRRYGDNLMILTHPETCLQVPQQVQEYPAQLCRSPLTLFVTHAQSIIRCCSFGPFNLSTPHPQAVSCYLCGDRSSSRRCLRCTLVLLESFPITANGVIFSAGRSGQVPLHPLMSPPPSPIPHIKV